MITVVFNKLDFLQYIFSICFIFVEIYFGGLLCFYLHIIGTNIGYFIGSAPDHDLHITYLEIEKSDKITDWGEKQVRHSANFLNNNIFFTRFFGGINYQIEHHLFPTLNNHKLSIEDFQNINITDAIEKMNNMYQELILNDLKKNVPNFNSELEELKQLQKRVKCKVKSFQRILEKSERNFHKQVPPSIHGCQYSGRTKWARGSSTRYEKNHATRMR